MNTTAKAVSPGDDVKVVGEIIEVRVDRIRRYEKQPRTFFDQSSLEKLAKSIREDGQREPIEICRLNGEQNTEQPFLLVDGERRWRAKQIIGEKETIRAILSDIKDEAELFRRSVMANLHREDMTPVDVANAIDRLFRESKMRREEIADMFGKSVTWVDQYRSLQNLAPKAQKLLDPNLPKDQQLKVTVALQIAKVPIPELQLQLAQESIAQNLPATDVMRKIGDHAAREGFSVLGRTRRPSDDWKYIRSTLGRVAGSLERIGKIDLEWVLLHRDDGRDKELIERQVEAILTEIETLERRTKEIQENIDAVHD